MSDLEKLSIANALTYPIAIVINHPRPNRKKLSFEIPTSPSTAPTIAVAMAATIKLRIATAGAATSFGGGARFLARPTYIGIKTVR